MHNAGPILCDGMVSAHHHHKHCLAVQGVAELVGVALLAAEVGGGSELVVLVEGLVRLLLLEIVDILAINEACGPGEAEHGVGDEANSNCPRQRRLAEGAVDVAMDCGTICKSVMAQRERDGPGAHW
mgnify:CR=1 FL=1